MKKSVLLLLSAAALFATACSQQNSAEELAHKEQVVKANDEMLNKGNVDFADEVFADSYRGQGPQFIKERVENLRKAFPDLQVEIGPIVAEGNMLGWRRTHTGTHQGKIMGYAPTGKKISWEDFILTRYDENDKVAEEWGAGNLREVLQRESKPEHKPEEVIATVRRAMDALNNKDAKAYIDGEHPKNTRFLPTGPGLFRGVSTVEAMEKDFQNGLDFNMQLVDPEVAFFGNTAVLTGYQTGTNRFPNGMVIDGKRKYSAVLIWENGKWENVHFHISKVD